MYVLNHNPIRKYYIVRNTNRLILQYKKDFPGEVKELKYRLLLMILKVLFFEKDKKINLYICTEDTVILKKINLVN